MAVSNIGVFLGKIVFKGFEHFTSVPMETQQKTLETIMKRNKDCELGCELRVTKNRITRLALKGTKFEGLDEFFKGPTVMAYSEDPISACKLCVEFAKANEKFVVVGGALSSGVLSMAEVERLATIPSMEELRARLIGLLQTPGSQLARVAKAYSEKEAA